MSKFIVRQSIDIDISYVIEAETLEDALTYGNFDESKIISIDHLSWDKPYDAEVLEDNAVLRFLTPVELAPYKRAGIL